MALITFFPRSWGDFRFSQKLPWFFTNCAMMIILESRLRWYEFQVYKISNRSHNAISHIKGGKKGKRKKFFWENMGEQNFEKINIFLKLESYNSSFDYFAPCASMTPFLLQYSESIDVSITVLAVSLKKIIFQRNIKKKIVLLV